MINIICSKLMLLLFFLFGFSRSEPEVLQLENALRQRHASIAGNSNTANGCGGGGTGSSSSGAGSFGTASSVHRSNPAVPGVPLPVTVATNVSNVCEICMKTCFADGKGQSCFFCRTAACKRCAAQQSLTNNAQVTIFANHPKSQIDFLSFKISICLLF